MIDFGFGGLLPTEPGAWAPGETLTIVIDTDPDLGSALLGGTVGFAKIQGAGGSSPVGGPASYQLRGVVPEPSPAALIAVVGAAALSARSRTRRRARGA